jgi:hypothetical protein
LIIDFPVREHELGNARLLVRGAVEAKAHAGAPLNSI